MRVLQINQCHFPRGGADIVFLSTIEALKNRGHDVSSFSTIGERNTPTEWDRYFIEAPDLRSASLGQKLNYATSYLYNQNAVRSLEQLIDNFQPEVAHVHLFHATLSVSVLEALYKKNVPVVHTVHDYRLLCPVNTMMDSNKNVCERCVKGSPLNCVIKRCSDGSLAQSSMVAMEAIYWRKFKSPFKYIDHFHFVSDFCRSKHIDAIPELEDVSSVHYNFPGIERRSAILKEEKYYLYFGRISSEKGILTLLKAWAKLSPEFRLKVVGTGSMMGEVKDFVSRHSISNVEFLGYKSGDKLTEIIAKAFFVIVPSEWYENNPMTIVESYHLGVPVLGADIGGIPEIIVNGKTGFIFQPKNYEDLYRVIVETSKISETQYLQFSERCMAFADDHFSEISNYEYLMHVYKKVISDKQNILVK